MPTRNTQSIRKPNSPRIPENGKYNCPVPDNIRKVHGAFAHSGDSAAMLRQMVSLRARQLVEHRQQLEESILARRRLTTAVQSQIDREICRARSVLLQPDPFPTQHEARSRRVSLEEQIANLYKERRHQEIVEWQDATALHRERRSAEKELRNVLLDLGMAQHIGIAEPPALSISERDRRSEEISRRSDYESLDDALADLDAGIASRRQGST